MNKIICNDKLKCHNAFHSNWSKFRSQYKNIIVSQFGNSATIIVNLISTRSELCDMHVYMTHSGYVEAVTSKLYNCHIEFINRYGMRMLQQKFLTLPYFSGVRISLSLCLCFNDYCLFLFCRFVPSIDYCTSSHYTLASSAFPYNIFYIRIYINIK